MQQNMSQNSYNIHRKVNSSKLPHIGGGQATQHKTQTPQTTSGMMIAHG